MRYHILLFLSLILAFAACEKDSTTEVVTFTQTTLSGETVTANFYGQLTNDQGEVVQDAEVRIGNKQTTTDQEGLWRINSATVVKDQAFIQFASTDHHKGSRTLLVDEAKTYEVDVEMLAFTGNNLIDATAGGTASVAGSNASVTFPTSAFAKTDGTPYTGTVTVEAAYLDPNDLSTANRMPGDLRATTSEGLSRLLVTYGMMSVELFDNAGNQLQLADGQNATISLPVTGDAANTAPESIPLWYFDEATAQWIEEGTATLQNGSYVGEVSHFTFWNCDIPTEYIRLCGTVIFEGVDSTTAANIRLIIESLVWGSGYGYTDENGQFCGIVPANETLTFLIDGGRCNAPSYSVTIGPYATDTDLGTIIVPLPQNFLTTVSGTASCNGDPLTSGAVRIMQNGGQLTTTSVESDGSFTASFISCDTTELTVQVINYATAETSDNLSFAFNTNINTGDIESCSRILGSYFILTFDGERVVGDSAIMNVRNEYYNMLGSLASSTPNGRAELTFFIEDEFGTFPDVATVGQYTLPVSSGVNLVNIPNIPQYQYSLEGVAFEIISESSSGNPYVTGSIGPAVVTRLDSLGVTTDHSLEITFSALSF